MTGYGHVDSEFRFVDMKGAKCCLQFMVQPSRVCACVCVCVCVHMQTHTQKHRRKDIH